MGKFDGILICSDIDGTFRCNEETVKVNKEAVKYFTDNGGKFTFVTGRNVSHLKETGLLEVINAPAGLLNGSVVFDYEKEKIVTEKRLDYTLEIFLKNIKECGKCVKGIAVFNGFEDEAYNECEPDNIPYDIMNVFPIKILVRFDEEEDANNFRDACRKNEFFKNTYISKSWSVGVEFNILNGTKGDALLDIKKYLGNIHTTVGIGDYENDIKLLTHADIKVATGNAIDELKKYADFTVKKCEDYAIKDLIEILDKRY